MSYNKETDYEAKINEAVANGDYESAAIYEKSRNEKIDGENLNYEKTDRFSGWLDKTDYSDVLREQMSGGASRNSVAQTLKKRVNKAKGTTGLTQYAADDVYDEAIRYIMGGTAQFKSRYDSKIEELEKSLKNKKFSYDPYDDELYEYYRKQYTREGKRAMEDLLGELASNTGGSVSSYAVSAAAQMQNYYNEKLTDKIPELYADAYDRYLEEIGLETDLLESLIRRDESDYKRYIDSVEQSNKEKEFDYKAFLEEQKREERLASEEKEYEYLMRKLDEEALENSRKWAQKDFENEQDEIKNALEKWEKMGYLDEESARILGLPPMTHTTDYDYKKAQQYKIYNK